MDNISDRKNNHFGTKCYFYQPIIFSKFRETLCHTQISLDYVPAHQPQSCHSTPPFWPENMIFCITCDTQTQSPNLM